MMQMETDSWIENAGRGLMGKQVSTKDANNLLHVKSFCILKSSLQITSLLPHPLLLPFQIVTKNGQLKFVVDILLGVRFSMTGTFV